MEYINDFEEKTLESIEPVMDEKSGMPKFPTDGIYARCCNKCGHVYFVNYKELDYICKRCRGEYKKQYI